MADPAQDSYQGCQELWQGRLTVCHGQKILEIVIQSPCFTVGETGSEGRGLAQDREVAEPGRPGSAAAPDFSLIQLTSPSSAVEMAGTQGYPQKSREHSHLWQKPWEKDSDLH